MPSLTIPLNAKKRPLKRGSIVESPPDSTGERRRYTVRSCKSALCKECAGTGKEEWNVKLEGKNGKFMTTLRALHRVGYEAIEG